MQTESASAGIDVEVHNHFDSVPDPLKTALSPARVPFLESLSWFRCLASSLPSHHELRIYTASKQDHRDVLALFTHCARGSSRLSGLVSHYSVSSCIATTATGHVRASLLRAVFQALAHERPRWTLIDLRLLDEGCDLYQTCLESLQEAGFHLEPFFQYHNWYLSRAGRSFDDYWHRRPGALKNTLRRKTRSLAEGHRMSLRVATSSGPELEMALNDFIGIYSSSWKGPEPDPALSATWGPQRARLALIQEAARFYQENRLGERGRDRVQ